jgi:hypothetical protein
MREPPRARGRLAEDMTEPLKPATRSDHDAHDPMWMAALAAKDPDLAPAELARARGALESCGACADLFADLVAVSAAIPSAAIPARPRDFTLTPADAARLRSRGLRRWFSAIGSARDGITFPLALGLTTMGIAGLLLATVPGALSGSGGAAQALSTVGSAVEPASGGGDTAAPARAAAPAPAAASAAAPAATSAPAASSPAGSESTKAEFGAMSAAPSQDAAEEPVFEGDGGDTASDGTDQSNATDVSQDGSILGLTGLSALAVVAGILLLTGLALFVLRWTARRLNDG